MTVAVDPGAGLAADQGARFSVITLSQEQAAQG